MTTDRQDDSRNPEERLLALFLEAHPKAEAVAFETWVASRAELRDDPQLLHRLRALFAQWHRAAELLGDGLSSRRSNVGSFFRAAGKDRGANDERSKSAGLQVGQRVGHFTLRSFIAQGGMGQVWQAHDEDLRTDVALKLILPGRIDAHSLDLFAREARAGGRLRHPYIVTTLSTGRADGLTWIAQELVDGSWTLKDYLDQLRTEDTVPKDHYKSVALFVARVADGLQAAHDAGVIHRDVKPANILIAPDDTPRLTDFGLARVVDDSFLSQSGDLAGTWSYMSPEQVTAKRMGLDHRTDIFSLGVVLYELLTLRRPFEGDTTHQIAAQIITHEPPQASKIRSQCPRELAIICGKALEKAPTRRYATMREFSADLHRHLNHEPIVARPVGVAARGGKWVRRHPARAVAVASAAIIAVSSLAFATLVARANAERRLANSEIESSIAAQALGLVEQETALWPPTPELATGLTQWLKSTDALLARHRQAEQRAGVGRTASGFSESAASGTVRGHWEYLIRHLEEAQPAVRRRLEAAEQIRFLSIEGDAVKVLWESAINSVASSERYAGLRLSPQLGLVPLRVDPRSGLWEFWHVLSGDQPELDSTTDEWVIDSDTGIVLVLIPGGHAVLGTPILPESDPLHDWVVEVYDVQVSDVLQHEVDLDAFFISKYEMTQAQWLRARGTIPIGAVDFGDALPVNSVSWDQAAETVMRFQLSLPTEAQWEYAARGGREERFFTGQDEDTLKGYAVLLPDENLDGFPDRDEHGGSTPLFGFPWHNRPLAVGSTMPNPYGLHDVLGNVWEWSLEPYDRSASPRKGRGERRSEHMTSVIRIDKFFRDGFAVPPLQGIRPPGFTPGGKRVMRGGSYASAWTNARASMRKPWERQSSEPDVGLRPARSIR